MCGHMNAWMMPDTFTVKDPKDVFAPSGGWSSAVAPVAPWATQQQPLPAYANDPELKKAFGVELGRTKGSPFDAACKVFKENTGAALWIANHWLTDPLVIAAKDLYEKEVKAQSLLLDKDAFAVLLMETAQEKDPTTQKYRVEAKERVNLLKLYADVRGFIGKAEINNNFTQNNNEMKVVLVRAEGKPIIQASNDKSEILNDDKSAVPDLKIKLVSAR